MAADTYGRQTYHHHVLNVSKSGSLSLLEPSGPVQACNGIALPLPFSIYVTEHVSHSYKTTGISHTHIFSSVSPSTVLLILHLFQAVSHSMFPMRATYRPISSDSISSPHESIMPIIFSWKHYKYVNSQSLIFTVMTSHVSCGQTRFPCQCGFLPWSCLCLTQ
jgi:hypothetical protein